MVKILLTLLTLALLASCQAYADPTPTVTPSPTATQTPTPVPTRTLTPFTDAVLGVPAIVLPSAVNIRKSPDGIRTGKYLYVGDKVFVLGCSAKWCLVETVIGGETVVGHVYRGCLSSVAGALLCEAK